MSSAAVQAVQQSSRQFQQAAQGRDPYVAQPQQQPISTSSPASSRRQPRSSGGNGSAPNTPQQAQHASQNASPAMSTPRGQPLPASSHTSPADYQTSSYYAGQSQPPISAPPRTSSYPQGQNVPAYDDRPTSSAQYSGGYGSGSERERIKDDSARAAAEAARSRRQGGSSRESSGQYASEREPRQRPEVSRADTGPLDDPAILNRLVIADPEDDAQRERARIAEARGHPVQTDVASSGGLTLVGSEGVDDGGRGAGHRSRQEHLRTAQPRKETKFGDYILGQTVGEGEFGKVKMGWKREGGVQVAIKLIRRESVGSNPNRLTKIYREIAILRELQHPNIVRLHEMVETERHIGIILEYASGGELFDYILNHRYLKDNAARRLFAQLVSGVGYLHKKGIVHRDLKLENLLLDRNRNIIITDFGFANTFNPNDELGEEIEYNLSNKDYVSKMGLEQVHKDGHRRGDLMQTSCGSPCYAAPELVVSDSLYTGRKVDVWSCGVILYAMLAGYLPFDDDPANPEGDNINLLYKYIVSTPLTFPEYVTPHARDLLRRILVPDPRKRADLFEVARHSWLSEYAHVVGFITSSTTTTTDIANATVSAGELESRIASGMTIAKALVLTSPAEEQFEPSQLARSASVREPAKTQPISPGGLMSKHGPVVPTEEDKPNRQRDAKRRTVQVEYVPPQTQTTRGEVSGAGAAPTTQTAPVTAAQGKTRARGDSTGGPVEVVSPSYQQTQRPPVSMGPPAPRPGREPPRSVSDSTAFTMSPPSTAARPATQGTIGGSRLPSRGNSYGLPAAAQVASTNAEGRFSRPVGDGTGRERPLSQHLPADYQYGARPSSNQFAQPPQAQQPPRGHRRSSTVDSITKFFGRSNSRRSTRGGPSAEERQEKPSRAYPPVSMKAPIPNDNYEATGRPSTESRRTSFGFSRKPSENNKPGDRSSRRFSFLPVSFSRLSFSGNPKDESGYSSDSRRGSMQASRSRPVSKQQSSGMAFGRGRSPSPSQSGTTNSSIPVLYNSDVDNRRLPQRPQNQPVRGATAPDLMGLEYGSGRPESQGQQHLQQQEARQQQQSGPTYLNYHATSPSHPQTQSQQSERYYTPAQSQESHSSHSTAMPPPSRPQYPPGFNSYDTPASPVTSSAQGGSGQRRQPSVLQKPRRFQEAYETGAGPAQHSGSSGGARRVMDWFRKRGRERGA